MSALWLGLQDGARFDLTGFLGGPGTLGHTGCTMSVTAVLPPLHIGRHVIESPVVLAPMAGITNRTYPGTHPSRGSFFTRGTKYANRQ